MSAQLQHLIAHDARASQYAALVDTLGAAGLPPSVLHGCGQHMPRHMCEALDAGLCFAARQLAKPVQAPLSGSNGSEQLASVLKHWMHASLAADASDGEALRRAHALQQRALLIALLHADGAMGITPTSVAEALDRQFFGRHFRRSLLARRTKARKSGDRS